MIKKIFFTGILFFSFLTSACMAASQALTSAELAASTGTNEPVESTATSEAAAVTSPTATFSPTGTATDLPEPSPSPSPTAVPAGITRENWSQMAVVTNYIETVKNAVPGLGDYYQIDAIAISPDGQYVAIGGCSVSNNAICFREDSESRSFLLIVDTLTADIVSILPETETTVTGLAFSPDGKQLVVAVFPFRVFIWDIPGQSLVRTLIDDGGRQSLSVVKTHPNGSQIAVVNDKRLLIFNALTGNQITELPAQKYGNELPQYDATGSRIAVYTNEGTEITVYDTSNWNEVIQLQLPEPNANRRGVDFSPDGRRVAIVNNTRNPGIIVLDTATGEPIMMLDERFEIVNAVAFTPNNELLLVNGSYDDDLLSGISVWDLHTQQRLGVLNDFNYNRTMVFDQEGQSLLMSSFSNVSRLSMQDETISDSHAVVLDFFNAVSAQDYQTAALYYQPSEYDLSYLQEMGFDTANLTTLLEKICSEGGGICLPIFSILPGGGMSAYGEYDVFVQFQNPDGTVFSDPYGYAAFDLIVASDGEGQLKVSFIPFRE